MFCEVSIGIFAQMSTFSEILNHIIIRAFQLYMRLRSFAIFWIKIRPQMVQNSTLQAHFSFLRKKTYKEELSKIFFLKLFEQTYFWSWIQNFCLHLKIHMLMSWKPTSNNSYRPFNNSRLTGYLNPQRGIWKWLIKIIAHFMMFF